MLLQSLNFLKREFFKYYYENIDRMIPPAPIKNREFGFFLNKDKGMLRHKSFSSLKDFQTFILNQVPLDIYVSAARYEDPTNRDMSEKRLINADLFFDIDSEPPPNQNAAWVCNKCGEYGLGIVNLCEACGSETESIELVIPEQLKDALKEAEKLIHVLTNDFGIDKKHVSVFFSGNRGYHVHVDQEDFLHIGEEGRREIVDYLMIQGLEEKDILRYLKKMEKGISRTPLKGVRERVYSMVYEITRREKSSTTRLKVKTVLSIINRAVEELRVRIDPVVTIDVHRLMRMPESINSNSGMVKKRIELENLESFNPLKEAIAFGNEEVTLRVRVAPRFELGGKVFGPFKDEEVELPTYAAVYLVCKGLGVNVE
ncbi:MAG: DNA primase small subunit domain-containing protein [Thermoproteota archaeon]